MTLTRDQILQVEDITKELVSVPEWGGEVYVRGMTGDERDTFEGSLLVNRGKDQTVNLRNIRAKLASLTVCDEKGKRIFSEADTLALARKSAAALQRVFVVAQKLSGITDADVKDLAGELEKDPFGPLPTA